MSRTRARKQRSRKNRTRTRRGGYPVYSSSSSSQYNGNAASSNPSVLSKPALTAYSSPPAIPESSSPPISVAPSSPPISPASSSYSSPTASSPGIFDKFKKSLPSFPSLWGGRRKRRGGFKPYDPLQTTYGSAKGGRRRKSRKSRRSRR